MSTEAESAPKRRKNNHAAPEAQEKIIAGYHAYLERNHLKSSKTKEKDRADKIKALVEEHYPAGATQPSASTIKAWAGLGASNKGWLMKGVRDAGWENPAPPKSANATSTSPGDSNSNPTTSDTAAVEDGTATTAEPATPLINTKVKFPNAPFPRGRPKGKASKKDPSEMSTYEAQMFGSELLGKAAMLTAEANIAMSESGLEAGQRPVGVLLVMQPETVKRASHRPKSARGAHASTGHRNDFGSENTDPDGSGTKMAVTMVAPSPRTRGRMLPRTIVAAHVGLGGAPPPFYAHGDDTFSIADSPASVPDTSLAQSLISDTKERNNERHRPSADLIAAAFDAAGVPAVRATEHTAV